jgi:hypothetical protein
MSLFNSIENAIHWERPIQIGVELKRPDNISPPRKMTEDTAAPITMARLATDLAFVVQALRELRPLGQIEFISIYRAPNKFR